MKKIEDEMGQKWRREEREERKVERRGETIGLEEGWKETSGERAMREGR